MANEYSKLLFLFYLSQSKNYENNKLNKIEICKTESRGGFLVTEIRNFSGIFTGDFRESRIPGVSNPREFFDLAQNKKISKKSHP